MPLAQHIERRAECSIRTGQFKFGSRDRCLADAANADKADSRCLDPHPIAWLEQIQSAAIPRAAASADEAVFHRLVPRAGLVMQERGVVLAVPRLFLRRPPAAGRSRHLRVDGVMQPRAAEQRTVVGLEHLEAQYVDGDVSTVEVADDAFAAAVEGGCDNYDLVVLVECVLVQQLAEPFLERLTQVAAVGETGIDATKVFCLQRLGPSA